MYRIFFKADIDNLILPNNELVLNNNCNYKEMFKRSVFKCDIINKIKFNDNLDIECIKEIFSWCESNDIHEIHIKGFKKRAYLANIGITDVYTRKAVYDDVETVDFEDILKIINVNSIIIEFPKLKSIENNSTKIRIRIPKDLCETLG